MSRHHRMLLCSADIAATSPALAMIARFAPSVPVRDPARFQHEPRRALLDSATAGHVLGWQPRYRLERCGEGVSHAGPESMAPSMPLLAEFPDTTRMDGAIHLIGSFLP